MTTQGLNTIATYVGGSGTRPQWIAIGTGSSTVNAANVSLLTESDRNEATTIDITTAGQVTWIGDFSSTEMSGTNLFEFGVTYGATTLGSNIINRVVIGSITFDGDTELQVQNTIKFT
jgi:hypothetical protein